jgi:hypothetical protein
VQAWDPPEKLYLRTTCAARYQQALLRELNSCSA